MVGTFVLIVAGVGAGAISSRTDSDSLAASYQSISPNSDRKLETSNDNVDITKNVDPKVLQEQTETQAQQVMQARSELSERAQAASDELQAAQWVLPVTGYRLSAGFGQSGSSWSSTHTGTDMSGPSGSTIVSIAKGTVTEAGYDGAYGNKTVVTMEDGKEVWYAHQSRIAVSVGDSVDPGQTIGFTGATGNVTGPHLHLEIRPSGGDPVDPVADLAGHGVRL